MTYRLVGPDGQEHPSRRPGTLGGHRRLRIYGRLDCQSALSFIARGHYVQHRVFFADEATAIAAGYRPCGCCLPERHAVWKSAAAGQAARRLLMAAAECPVVSAIPPSRKRRRAGSAQPRRAAVRP